MADPRPKIRQPGNNSAKLNDKIAHDQLAGYVKHEFFGSSLIVNQKTLISNLERKKHLVEVVDSELYIDGERRQVHYSEIVNLKKALSEARK
jgi:hypothetical protein